MKSIFIRLNDLWMGEFAFAWEEDAGEEDE